LPLVVGSAIAGVFASVSPAEAIMFTVNGIDYDVTTVTTSYDANTSLLQSQPWWGNDILAEQFASTVAQGLPGRAGNQGPLFAIEASFVSDPFGGGDFTDILASVYDTSGNPPVVFTFVQNSASNDVYATATAATPVPFDFDPSFGVVALGGIWAGRKVIKKIKTAKKSV
jgi:hypothetical protein